MTHCDTEKPVQQFSKHRLWVMHPFTVSSLSDHLCKILAYRGWQVDSTPLDYRVLMVRKEDTRWTQAYTRKHGLFIDIVGPEVPAIIEILQTIYQQGEETYAPGSKEKTHQGSG
jgi:hypothetical protein